MYSTRTRCYWKVRWHVYRFSTQYTSVTDRQTDRTAVACTARRSERAWKIKLKMKIWKWNHDQPGTTREIQFANLISAVCILNGCLTHVVWPRRQSNHTCITHADGVCHRKDDLEGYNYSSSSATAIHDTPSWLPVRFFRLIRPLRLSLSCTISESNYFFYKLRAYMTWNDLRQSFKSAILWQQKI